MDLYAYSQIPKYEEIAKANGIYIPRLRGYSLMSEETHWTQEDVDDLMARAISDVYRYAMWSVPPFRPDSNHMCFDEASDRRGKKYLILETVYEPDADDSNLRSAYRRVVDIRWDKIHGKNRKAIKFAVKQRRKKVLKVVEAHNKYAGRNDVLRVHARIGGYNWAAYGGFGISKQPWFLEKVDDWFDRTYCDIYVKIQPVEKGESNELRSV